MKKAISVGLIGLLLPVLALAAAPGKSGQFCTEVTRQGEVVTYKKPKGVVCPNWKYIECADGWFIGGLRDEAFTNNCPDGSEPVSVLIP